MKFILDKSLLIIFIIIVGFLSYFSFKTAKYVSILEENITTLQKELTQSANYSFKVGPIEMSTEVSGSKDVVEKESNRFYICIILILIIILIFILIRSHNLKNIFKKEELI